MAGPPSTCMPNMSSRPRFAKNHPSVHELGVKMRALSTYGSVAPIGVKYMCEETSQMFDTEEAARQCEQDAKALKEKHRRELEELKQKHSTKRHASQVSAAASASATAPPTKKGPAAAAAACPPTLPSAGLVREASSTTPPHSLPFHWKGEVEFELNRDEEVDLDDGSKHTIRMPTWFGVSSLGNTGWKLKWEFEGPYRDELDTYTNYADALDGVHTEEDAESLECAVEDWMQVGETNKVASIEFELVSPTALPSNTTVKITHETDTDEGWWWRYTLPEPCKCSSVPLTIDVTNS